MNPSEYLSSYGVSRTAIREKLLSILSREDQALSSKEIEEKLGEDIDRVTLYRSIRLFEDKNIIHKIVIDDQTIKYKLINPKKGSTHPHFHCVECDKVLCLPETPLPQCNLPEGFSAKTQNTIVEGTCQKCNH
ncbi:Fur family transcriptional regulator [Carboxylicivirga sp. N1Y90]|uniref:Fur family transcriptional regulator n=1 Tax=Carboxylicivirga fragile TaxID=3417571 RepID=UPI003D325813|nr:transcriptional repressor [Marinilabiliaceae bacterium N1Y90]